MRGWGGGGREREREIGEREGEGGAGGRVLEMEEGRGFEWDAVRARPATLRVRACGVFLPG